MKEIKNLLLKRYKVIALWLESTVKLGTILQFEEENSLITLNGIRYNYLELDAYPHLFSPLPWYSDREVSEMPEYIKRGDAIIKISIGKDISESGSAWMFEKSPDNLRHRIQLFDCLPATEEQYNQYINRKNE